MKSSPWTTARRPVDPALPDHHVGRQEGLELAVLAVGRLAGDRARLVEAALVEQPLDPLPHRQPPAGVLALHALLAAHPPRQLLAAAQLLELRLPVHGGQSLLIDDLSVHLDG